MHCKPLHALPKFASTMQRVQVGNGQCVAVLFVIPVLLDVYGHRFEVFILVSEIHDNVDLVLRHEECVSVRNNRHLGLFL